MPVDFTKFPYPRIDNPSAATVTEAITADPIDAGYIVMTLKTSQPDALPAAVRDFARSLRAGADSSGLTEITAYRQLLRSEIGGAVPFDQPICEALLKDAAGRDRTRQEAAAVESFVLANPFADWVILLVYRTPELATKAATSLRDGTDESMATLASVAQKTTVGAFRNMKQYAFVARDPNVIQFFNLFPGPGNHDVLWQAWQDALPWFFEIAEFRSSFPLLALDQEQPLQLVNYAHTDSAKHFLHGTLYDPGFMESMKACYIDRGVVLPHPFFCKIEPV